QRIYVSINKLGQHIGDEANKLSSFLGTLARNGTYAPLNYVAGQHMSSTHRNDMRDIVKFDMDPLAKDWVMASLDKKWKDYKVELKSNYLNKRIHDLRVIEDQWNWLINFWKSDK
ncbi:hypothetical protein CFOL_v3_31086, partial [Cephalotus follicularis]